jgi:prolipoprotein diacylglyceryltransferase
MPVIIGFFIGRWSNVVNDKTENGEQMTDVRNQKTDDRGQIWQFGIRVAGKKDIVRRA